MLGMVLVGRWFLGVVADEFASVGSVSGVTRRTDGGGSACFLFCHEYRQLESTSQLRGFLNDADTVSYLTNFCNATLVVTQGTSDSPLVCS